MTTTTAHLQDICPRSKPNVNSTKMIINGNNYSTSTPPRSKRNVNSTLNGNNYCELQHIYSASAPGSKPNINSTLLVMNDNNYSTSAPGSKPNINSTDVVY